MLKFYDTYAFRIPQFPVTHYGRSQDFDSIDDYLRDALQQAEVREAIFLSSPDFYREVVRFLTKDTERQDPKRRDKFRASALKYLNRMSYRATPFGTFAASGVGRVTDKDEKANSVSSIQLDRSVQLDAAYLVYLANELFAKPGMAAVTRFYPNNTIVDIGQKSRYVEFIDAERGRAYNLSVFTNSEYIDEVRRVATGGATGTELARCLAEAAEVSEEEGLAFVRQLADARILVSEVEPMVVGIPYQDQLGQLLEDLPRRGGGEEVAATTARYAAHFRSLVAITDAIGTEVGTSDYGKIRDLVKAFHGKAYPTVIRLDARVPAAGSPELSQETAKHIRNGLRGLLKISRAFRNPAIATFREKFVQRFEDQVVPVMLALDPELGVGFQNIGSENFTFAPLVDNLPVPPRSGKRGTTSMEWDQQLHGFLLEKILRAEREGSQVVELTEEDLSNLSYNMAHVPPTSVAMVRLVREAGEEEPLVCFKALGKDSGTALLSRFAYLDKRTENLVGELCDFEDSAYPGCVTAEVNHLANLRIGNITERPKSRKHEIAFITKSNSTEVGLLPINDIFVGVRNGKVVLISQSLNQEVIPRLSTAHNYFHNCLPLYKFLGVLQEEYHGGYYEYAPHLGPLNKMLTFIPRLQYGRFVFRPASWQIPTREILRHKHLPFGEFAPLVRERFSANRWPTRFTIDSQGNPLYIDLDNDCSLFLFSQLLNRRTVQIHEAIGMEEAEQWFRSDRQGGFHHELLLPLRNEYFLNNGRVRALPSGNKNCTVSRTVHPGQEWLYYKFYLGAGTGEKLISEKFPLLIARLEQEGLIGEFFFLRYIDPEYHIRLRLRITAPGREGRVMAIVNELLADELHHGFIWKMQLDTYQRELERYAGDLTPAGEAIFAADSRAVLACKALLTAEINKDMEWLLILHGLQVFLDVFGLTGEAALPFLKGRRDVFSHIFNTNKLQKRELTQRYNNHQTAIIGALRDGKFPFERSGDYVAIFERMREELQQLFDTHLRHQPAAQREELLESYLHMFILRFAISKNRLHEHVLFYMLERHHLRLRGQRIAASKVTA